ncbi:MAG: hypothetical protein KDE19_08650 [Caldilineaceae bacterium]|nr:hypothetical protein [Caldilineaceae bacterium]
MTQLTIPDFQTYEEEAEFWDNLDTADSMEDDGEWFQFETGQQQAVRVPILPNIIQGLQKRASAQGVSLETLVNVLLMESLRETVN